MTKTLMDLKVGDIVYFVPDDKRVLSRRGHLEVTKVGKKYVYFDKDCATPWTHKDSLAIGVVSGCYGGRIYLSEDDYLLDARWQHLWINLRYLECSKERKALIFSILEQENLFPKELYDRKQ